MCSRKACRSCLTSGSRRVTLVRNPMKSHEREKKKVMIVIKTNGTCQWSSVTQIFLTDNRNHDGDGETFEVMTST